MEGICGNAVSAELLKAANIPAANWLLLAIGEPMEGGQIIALARSYQPNLKIIAHAHTDVAIAHLKEQGADHIVTGDYPVALGMTEYLIVPSST